MICAPQKQTEQVIGNLQITLRQGNLIVPNLPLISPQVYFKVGDKTQKSKIQKKKGITPVWLSKNNFQFELKKGEKGAQIFVYNHRKILSNQLVGTGNIDIIPYQDGIMHQYQSVPLFHNQKNAGGLIVDIKYTPRNAGCIIKPNIGSYKPSVDFQQNQQQSDFIVKTQYQNQQNVPIVVVQQQRQVNSVGFNAPQQQYQNNNNMQNQQQQMRVNYSVQPNNNNLINSQQNFNNNNNQQNTQYQQQQPQQQQPQQQQFINSSQVSNTSNNSHQQQQFDNVNQKIQIQPQNNENQQNEPVMLSDADFQRIQTEKLYNSKNQEIKGFDYPPEM